MMPEENKQKNNYIGTDTLIHEISERYTISFKQACQELKCSRQWGKRYIQPNVPVLHLPSGRGHKIVNASLYAEGNAANGYNHDLVYLDEKAFRQLIYNSIISCKKRSKQVYRSYFVPQEHIRDYYEKLLNLNSLLSCCRHTQDERQRLRKEMESLYLKFAGNPQVSSIIHPSIVECTKRTAADFIDVPVPKIPIDQWMATHDLLDYGDSEELIYRDFFRKGCIRIEIALPDKKGCLMKKGRIYYVNDPAPIHPVVPGADMIQDLIRSSSSQFVYDDLKYLINRFDRLNIKQSAWMEYNRLLGHSVDY